MPEPGNKPTPALSGVSAAGAEPYALCMSCKAEFPAGSSECPICFVPLSVVRKCPSCQRVQSANHLRCIYCSAALGPVIMHSPTGDGALAIPAEEPRHWLPTELGLIIALVVVVGVILFFRLRPAPKLPDVVTGQSFVLHHTVLRSEPSVDAAPLMDLNPPLVVDIFDEVVDTMGNRWDRISAQNTKGYVRTRELAPPRGNDPERTFDLLKHSLIELDDPAILPDAVAAVDYYIKAFPKSPNVNEAKWLLAECTRRLAERSNWHSALVASAREQYGKIAESQSEFADRARQALAELPEGARGGRASRRATRSAGIPFTVMGGSTSGSPTPTSPDSPVRRLTVVSQTPIAVLLTHAVRVAGARDFQGTVDENIIVNNDVAIPSGSLSLLAFMQTDEGPSAVQTVSFRLTGVIVDHQTYSVSSEPVRVQPPPNSGQVSLGNRSDPQLPAGTRVIFRLTAPLVVVRR
jgi:hypothetical protein